MKIDGRLKEFNFRKPNGREDGLFTVDVIDSFGKRIIFNMEKTNSHWKIISEEIPGWLLESEDAFSEIIEEEFKSIA